MEANESIVASLKEEVVEREETKAVLYIFRTLLCFAIAITTSVPLLLTYIGNRSKDDLSWIKTYIPFLASILSLGLLRSTALKSLLSP